MFCHCPSIIVFMFLRDLLPCLQDFQKVPQKLRAMLPEMVATYSTVFRCQNVIFEDGFSLCISGLVILSYHNLTRFHSSIYVCIYIYRSYCGLTCVNPEKKTFFWGVAINNFKICVDKKLCFPLLDFQDVYNLSRCLSRLSAGETYLVAHGS